jgi:hypothetical protein
MSNEADERKWKALAAQYREAGKELSDGPRREEFLRKAQQLGTPPTLAIGPIPRAFNRPQPASQRSKADGTILVTHNWRVCSSTRRQQSGRLQPLAHVRAGFRLPGSSEKAVSLDPWRSSTRFFSKTLCFVG